MSVVNDVTTQNYSGSLLSAQLLSAQRTLLLNRIGPQVTNTVTDNNNQLVVGESVTLGDGRTATVLGSGTIQPGVRVAGIVVPLGSSQPVVLVQTSSGQLVFLYPEGAPNLLGAVALITDIRPVDYTFPGGIICFTEGTLIRTRHGDVPVEELHPGMQVWTRDAGLQEIAWTGSRTLSAARLAVEPHRRPVLIRKDALGPGLPARDLTVSPQHRMLVGSRIAQRMFDDSEVLVAAKHLTAIPGIEEAPWRLGVTYVHFLCADHQVVMSEGACSESLHTGPEALKALSDIAQRELLDLFPELALMSPAAPARPAARRLLNGREGRKLAQRHAQNGMMAQA